MCNVIRIVDLQNLCVVSLLILVILENLCVVIMLYVHLIKYEPKFKFEFQPMFLFQLFYVCWRFQHTLSYYTLHVINHIPLAK